MNRADSLSTYAVKHAGEMSDTQLRESLGEAKGILAVFETLNQIKQTCELELDKD